MSDVILNAPMSDMYATLKTRIIEQFTDSKQNQIRKLLQDMELGDVRTSQLLHKMCNLSGKNLGAETLKFV